MTIPFPAFPVRLVPSERTFIASEGQSLLLAAAAAGIELRSSCRNGTCRTCLCRLESGSVRYLVEWPGLSADEKREGWILPCVAVAQSALLVREP